jgi:2-hydroxycyclohexanecarboxyl-CoA dehydrogenase
MDLQLGGHVAVVVGGARGIGAAIAAAFVAEGARIAVLDAAATVEAAAVTMATNTGASVIGLRVDAADYAEMLEAAARVEAELGAPDHVVYAAGLGSGKLGFPFWNLEPADWDRVLRVNLMGAVHAAHAFAPGMAGRGRGTLTLLASVAGQIGSQTDPPYSAAKAAVINFAQCAARDLAAYGVRVNSICPGMVQTELNRSVWQAWHDRQPEGDRLSYEQWGADKVCRVAPLGRWQQPEEIGALAVYLASPHAANITGQTLNVDGGQVMHA